MTPERIAELRQLVRDGFDLGRALSDELLDALEAAQQEIADLKRGGVVEALEILRRIAETKLEEDDDDYEMDVDIAYSKLSEIVNDCRYALRAQPTQAPANGIRHVHV